MSYGADERDIHKHIWEVPIPTFNPQDPLHRRLAELGKSAENIAAGFDLDPELHFAASRRHIRELLEQHPEGQEINDIVFELIG